MSGPMTPEIDPHILDLWQLSPVRYLREGHRDYIEGTPPAQLRRDSFSWQIKQFSRRSELFGDLREPFPG